MNRKSTPPIPEAIVQLQRQLDQFRSTQPRRTKLPESLWQAAVELARQHGIYPVAHPLRLDYMGLKKRLGGIPIVRRKASKPAFVELIAPPATPPQECAIEFESSGTARCGSSGRHRRRPIGEACCAPGEKRKDDSDRAADTDSGCGGSHRWKKRDRRHCPAMSREAERRSIFRLPVYLPHSPWHGHSSVTVRRPGVLAGHKAFVQGAF